MCVCVRTRKIKNNIEKKPGVWIKEEIQSIFLTTKVQTEFVYVMLGENPQLSWASLKILWPKILSQNRKRETFFKGPREDGINVTTSWTQDS